MNTTRCPQCGFRAELQTETNFHTCRQCRAMFRVFSGQSVSEQYFRHEQNDPLASGVLLGLLDLEGIHSSARQMAITFGYHPFWFADLEDGSTRFRSAGTTLDGYPLPPVPPPGDLEFIPPGRLFPPATIEPQALFSGTPPLMRLRLLQLPLYLINYEYSGQQYQATVSGSTWQVHLQNLPEESTIRVTSSRLLFLGAYVALLLIVGTLAPNIFWRCPLVCLILLIAWWFDRSAKDKD